MLNFANFLTMDEIQAVVAHFRKCTSDFGMLRLAVFRLSACCGLRVKEMSLLDLNDFVQNGDRPYLIVRPATTKGKEGKRRGRAIHLWWDQGTYTDLCEWYDWRMLNTHGENGPFLCSLKANHWGMRLGRRAIQRHWLAVIKKVLGPERAMSCSIHKGRHSFCSHAIAAGIPLPAVRDAMGHSSLAITDLYTHAMDTTVRDLFGK